MSPETHRRIALASALALAIAILTTPVAAAQTAPTCTPSAPDGSAALAGGALTVSPAPGTRDASRATQISFLGDPLTDIERVAVSGSRSGSHAGRLIAYSQGDGASFLARRRFAEGETITVRARLRMGSRRVPLSWRFVTARADALSHSLETPPPPPKLKQTDYERLRSRPDLRPPAVTVDFASASQAPGDLFLAPYAGAGQYGPMILDGAGGLVWFKPLAPGERAADLRVQEYEGRPVLTWWQDPLHYGGRHDAGIVLADSSYRTIAVVRAGNGYKADLHAFHILPDGVALVTVYDAIRCNLSSYGGLADGALADTVVQDIDLKTGLVRREWHSLDHVPLSDSYMPMGRHGGSLAHPWDWFHINAVSPQPGGDLLVSSRNTWAAYEVDAHSGRVLWRLGGRRSSFAMGPGTRTAWQHDVTWQPDGTISFFDNGASPQEHAQSRGLVVRLDMRHMRVTFVRSLLHHPPLLSESQGDLQSLGGDWLVGWGQAPYFSEFAPGGAMLFDAHLPVGFQSYTVLGFPWSGRPSEPPRIAVRTARSGGLTVYASWNGATGVVRWRLQAGPKPNRLAPIASVPRSGFETSIAVPGGSAFVQAQALDADGRVLASSAALATTGGRR